MKKYKVTYNRRVVDDLGNTVAVCTYQNAARRIARLLNQDQRKVS